jgi:enoyl-CoA hydratase
MYSLASLIQAPSKYTLLISNHSWEERMSVTLPPAQDILIRQEGRAGLITLNRPKAMNALTLNMIRTLEAQFIKWGTVGRIYAIIIDAAPGRAFCGGGDMRAVMASGLEDPSAALQFFREEYQHNWTLDRFIKPRIALIDGIVMGGGVGISIYGTHRVASENIIFAMPETGIGFFPDIGAGYFLPRFPGETGMYLGLTGVSVGQADAHYIGYVTHCVPTADFDRIRQAAIEGEPIDTVLDNLHRDPGESRLSVLRPAIDRIFSADSVEEILARLDAENSAYAEWAHETATLLRQRAPMSLKVAFRQIREGRKAASLAEALKTEFRLVSRMAFLHDVREGVRAQLIDKDRAPKWQPATLADVTDAMVDACFAPLPAGEPELELIERWRLVE